MKEQPKNCLYFDTNQKINSCFCQCVWCTVITFIVTLLKHFYYYLYVNNIFQEKKIQELQKYRKQNVQVHFFYPSPSPILLPQSKQI